MNTTADPPPLGPQQPPAQPPRSSFSCDTHPQEQFTGFCPSCLCERLYTLDQNDAVLPSSSSSRRPSFSSIKSILKLTSSNNPINETSKNVKPAKPSFFPELRRSKSFSASKNENFSGVFEPQRHSCDVRGRNTLWTLFSLDDNVEAKESQNPNPVSGSVLGKCPFPEENEQEQENEVDDIISEISEIRVLQEPVICENVVEQSFSNEGLVKIKDHLDLENVNEKEKETKKASTGINFWSAASGFSKKWQKWMKQKRVKKSNQNGGGSGLATLPVEKPISRQFRETQSEIADYGFGRRSCDTDPRFSLDAGRMSFDDARYSFDEPRASWDGYLIGRNFPRLPPMVEDVPVVHVPRIDANIPVVEEDTLRGSGVNGEDENVPGGSVQTRDYYLDSSCKRRKSLDRSSSIRKTAASVVAEIEDMKVVSNAKVSPATIDYVSGGKVLNGDNRDLRDSNSNSLRDDCSETFELGASVIGNNGEVKGSKKSRRWSWNIWGFIQRHSGGNKDDDEERYNGRGNGVERSFSESWRENNGEGRGGFNRKVFRSNSSVSWRNSNGSMRKPNVETNGNGKKKKDEFVLERNRSARYSPPNHIDNGLLRFYLTPLRNSRRGKFGKSRSNNSHSIARSVLRLY